MITKVTYALSRAKAKDTARNLEVGNKATYDNRYEVADFDPDDLITRYFFESEVPAGVVSPIPLSFPIGTTLPIKITSFATTYAAYGDYPGILVLNSDTGDEITNPTINRNPVTTPDTVTINAANSGSGVTDSALIIVIKQ